MANTRERPDLRRVCACPCGRVWMGVPARLGSRPVPFRGVSHRSPPAIHSSFSQPARPTACQCPTARRTVCTQKRSGSPSLPPSDYPALSYALSAFRRHPTSRHPQPISLSLFCLASESPSFSHTSVVVCLTRTRSLSVCTTAAVLPTLSYRDLSSSSSGSRVTLGERTRAPAIVLSLSDLGRLIPRLALVLSRFPTSSSSSPLRLFCPSSSYVFSLPPNPPPRHSTLPPRSARDSAVSVAPRQPTVLPLVPQLLSRPALLPLAPE